MQSKPFQEDLGPSCGVSIAARAAKALEQFPEDDLHVLFLLKNSESLEPATASDAAKFDQDAGWKERGTVLVDDELLGRKTYFPPGEVGTMLLSKGFVIQAINNHDFAAKLPEVIEK